MPNHKTSNLKKQIVKILVILYLEQHSRADMTQIIGLENATLSVFDRNHLKSCRITSAVRSLKREA